MNKVSTILMVIGIFLFLSACNSIEKTLSQEAKDQLHIVINSGGIGQGSYEIRTVKSGEPQFSNYQDAYCITVYLLQKQTELQVFLQGTPGGLWHGFKIGGDSAREIWVKQGCDG